jgi:helicase SWR1
MDNSGPSSELGPVAGPSSQPALNDPANAQVTAGLSRNGSVARRNLRARPSEPSSVPSPISKRARSDTNTKLRPPTERELDSITKALSEESLAAKRDGVVREKEAEVKRVVDGHDDAVREKFHLERFISIFEGWNPKVCASHGEAVRTSLTWLGR